MKKQGGKVGQKQLAFDITERKRAESQREAALEALAQQNEALSKLNHFAIELSMLSPEDNLEVLITKRIKEITGAVAAIFSEYNPENRTTTIRHIEMEPGLLGKTVGLLGRQVEKIHSPVSDEMYREITTKIVGMRRTLYEASFGAVSRPVGAAIQALLKVDRFIGIACLIEGKLYGTSLLAMSKGQPDPSKQILENFSFLAALSLRRKQAEERLEKSSQLLRDTGEMAKVGGWELDLSTNEVSWTEVYRIHGVKPGFKPTLEEAMNFYVPESRSTLEEALKKAAKTGEPYDLESLFIPSGSKDKIWVRLLGRAVYSGGKIVKLVGTFQNIDKYKRAEEALRESEEIFRQFMKNSPIYVFFKDENIKAIRLSDNYEKMLGRPIDELLGKNMGELFPSELAKSMVADDMRILAEDKQIVIEEELNGRYYTTFKFPIHIEGKPRYLAGFTMDITERRRAEEALRKSESNLRALAMKLSRAEERERHHLAVYLHDEIGQSLALLQMKLGSFATASKSKSDKHDIKVLRDLLETIIEQTHTLTFELSPPVLQQLGLEAAIEWAGEKISRDHGLDFTFNDDGIAKSLNPDLQAILFRCVCELMLNTVKHAKAKRLTVAIAREGEKILYTIADDGLGFDPSLYDTRTEEPGFGLLSVREHLAAMGGNCRIQSTPGQGTRITLTVPVGGTPEERDAACRMTDGSLIPENEP